MKWIAEHKSNLMIGSRVLLDHGYQQKLRIMWFALDGFWYNFKNDKDYSSFFRMIISNPI
jgi:hypothetical protein